MERSTQEAGWNIFGVVLADILAQRGYRLGHLDDRAGIHKEKVRRLQHSLEALNFQVLSPEELIRVNSAFGLTLPERIRLRAAVLATAMEAKLMDRIAPQKALEAAWLILPVLERALLQELDDDNGYIRLSDIQSSEALEFFDQRFAGALDAIERAQLVSQLAETTQSRHEEQALKAEALALYRDALLLLEQAESAVRDDQWRYWMEQAQGGAQRMVRLTTPAAKSDGESST